MTNQNLFSNVIAKTKKSKPLIHCITNPISIHNCANTVLAVGASPIMAEHPLEVEQITEKSHALAVNLGNITDARMKSISISVRTATSLNIPVIIDLVGIGISDLRLDFAKKLIDAFSFSVIKGNMSEIKALLGMKSHAFGIDVGVKDEININSLEESIKIIKSLASKLKSVVVATGIYDIISDGNLVYVVKNGTAMLSKITGTGCMLTVLIASYMASNTELAASVAACLTMGISGELSITDNEIGTSTFESNLLDNIFLITDDIINKYAKLDLLK